MVYDLGSSSSSLVYISLSGTFSSLYTFHSSLINGISSLELSGKDSDSLLSRFEPPPSYSLSPGCNVDTQELIIGYVRHSVPFNKVTPIGSFAAR